jgi:hypothetical protein
MRNLLHLLIVLVITTNSFAQGFNISGKVLDEEHNRLPFANVCINNTTVETVADQNGSFSFRYSGNNTIELVNSFVSYQSGSVKFVLNKDMKDLTLRLKTRELETVLISAKRKGDAKRKFKQFEDALLGNNKAAKSSYIVDPDVIKFKETNDKMS